jgi:hypothetical protein
MALLQTVIESVKEGFAAIQQKIGLKSGKRSG